MRYDNESSPFGFIAKGIFSVLGCIVAAVMFTNMFENLDAHDIMVVQSPMSGELTWHTEPGWKWQGFGKLTVYPRRSTYSFEQPIRFNDNGHGTAKGSVQIELPLDAKHLTMIHKAYGSSEALHSNLVSTSVSKCIYLSGPLMSSKESAAEKRNDLLHYIEDQIKNGVYKTIQKDIQVPDPINDKQMKLVTVVQIVTNNGLIARQEQAAMNEFGLKTFNFAIKDLSYDKQVEAQIKDQQALAMKVQTAIAQSKEAEQRAITAAKEGEAQAAKAKWDQEVIKAQAVTEAEQQRDVAKLQKDAAEFGKQKAILEGQGEAEKRRLIMSADGALSQKLEAYKYVHERYAQAIKDSKHPLTPSVVMGSGANGGNIGLSLADMLAVKTAKDLGLKVNPE